MIAELKSQAKIDREFLENEYKQKIKKLEDDLKIARSGFEAER